MSTMSTSKVKRSLRLLSIDNGGFRGLSPLLILREIMLKIQKEEGLQDIPRPCEIFDLAGGTGTGGIIVIMLFRLQMSINDAIDAYIKLAEHVFSEKKWFFQEGTFKATRLEEAMLSIIQQSGGDDPKKVLLLNGEGPKCFVTGMDPFDQIYFPRFLCSWVCSDRFTYYTVVEAVRATTAVPTFFKPARVGYPTQVRYLDVNLQCSSPAKYVVNKARDLYGDRPISCLLSLGTGTKCPLRLHPRTDFFQKCFSTKLRQALRDVDKNCEQQEVDIASEFSRHSSSILYIRLNDDDTHSPLADWRSPNDLQDRTKKYLATVNLYRSWWFDQLLQVLKGTDVANPAEQTCESRPALHEIYHDDLLTQGRGSPLWFPGPTSSLSQAYRQYGVNVGDVGIIKADGPFDFLFNIFMPADHPINSGGVPDRFQPLENSGVCELQCDVPGTIIGRLPRLSIHRKSSDLVFETSILEGAVLVLPMGAWRKSTRDKEGMRDYMMSNIRAWYHYARKRRALRNGDLVLVYHCDKAPSCGMASFSGCEGQATAFTFKCLNEGSPPYQWVLNRGPGKTSMKIGPYVGENNDLSGVVNNQCVFLRTLNAQLSEKEWEEFE